MLEHSIRTQKKGIVTRITEQIQRLQERVENAADRAGRDTQTIQIVAVSKKNPPLAIREAQAAGLIRFGENYVQEALPKIAAIDPPVEWHFIGAVQSNKAGDIAGHFDWAHAVASARAARRLSAKRAPGVGELQVCIQLRPTDGGERAGILEEGAQELAALIEALPNLRLRGLMIMPLPGLSDAGIRAEFARARRLLNGLIKAGHRLDTLSMGMSGDLEAAIMEGSTMLRIGTGIFGPRNHD